MGRRTRIDIIADILVAIQGKGTIKPTHLMYKANMSHAQMQPYLEELVKKDLVARVTRDRYEYITLTDKGCDFMEKLRQMREFEQAFGI